MKNDSLTRIQRLAGLLLGVPTVLSLLVIRWIARQSSCLLLGLEWALAAAVCVISFDTSKIVL